MKKTKSAPTLESLLLEMIANQQLLSMAIAGMSEKVAELEKRLDQDRAGQTSGNIWDGEDDPKFEEAKAVVVQAGKASTSFLQRKLNIGYSRSAKLIDLLEQAGIISPQKGASPRKVLVTKEDQQAA